MSKFLIGKIINSKKIIIIKDAGENTIEIGSKILFNDGEKNEIAECLCNKIDHSCEKHALYEFVKKVDAEAEEKFLKMKKREEKAFRYCLNRIQIRQLPMKLIKVKFYLDNSKAIFYFTANGRIDFRELVKDLAGKFKTRIEMRQIGIRDQAKLVGGLGPCGRILCCCSFIRKFEPVSIKIAKNQGLAFNINKISGVCGKLMCCLRYENE